MSVFLIFFFLVYLTLLKTAGNFKFNLSKGINYIEFSPENIMQLKIEANLLIVHRQKKKRLHWKILKSIRLSLRSATKNTNGTCTSYNIIIKVST